MGRLISYSKSHPQCSILFSKNMSLDHIKTPMRHTSLSVLFQDELNLVPIIECLVFVIGFRFFGFFNITRCEKMQGRYNMCVSRSLCDGLIAEIKIQPNLIFD